MWITKLELNDYKCFENLVLENLGKRVVLVGRNGCGKSAVLEAIAVLKEFVATYNPQKEFYRRNLPKLGTHDLAWPINIPLPIRAKQSSAIISADLVLEESEKKFCGAESTNVKVSIKIEQSGKIIPQVSNKKIVELFRFFKPDSQIGIIDYINPQRTFPLIKISSINLNQLSINQQRMERIELERTDFNYQKFKSIKQYIISKQLEDFSYLQSTGELKDSLSLLKQIFEHFFGPKKLIGYTEYEDEMQVQVETPWGRHDIDQMSSGEKELFSIFVNLFRIRSLPSVILYDEPERHLNAGLESKIIPALDKLNTENQIWFATHGIEFIGSVPLDEIIELKRKENRIEPERITEDSKTRRIRLFEALGAKVGLQLASNRIIFVEGKDANSDKFIIEKLAGTKIPGVMFVSSGPATGVMTAGTHAALLIEEASEDASFLMVMDRDYRDDADVESLKKKGKDRVFVWNCHELENLLLDDETIFEVLKSNGEAVLKTPDDVNSELLNAAKGKEEIFVSQWVSFRAWNNAHTKGDEEQAHPKDEENFKKMAASRIKKCQEAYSEKNSEAMLSDAKKVVSNCFKNGTWKVLLPGKEILEEFRKKYLPDIKKERFRNQIVECMIKHSKIPSEIGNLCAFIKSH